MRDLEVQTGGKFNYELAKTAKKKVARKKREKAPGEALRDRLKTKLFDKRTLKRVAETYDAIQKAKAEKKFSHQFNY